VAAERAAIKDAAVFVFFYPLWFNVPPAILSGYVQRVFGMGFGYGPQKGGQNQRLLLGRSLLSFSSSGAPAEWLRQEGGWEALVPEEIDTTRIRERKKYAILTFDDGHQSDIAAMALMLDAVRVRVPDGSPK
jgi:putative NADPH-quinone reductase